MPEELDAPAILATLIILAVLASSTYLWIRRIQTPICKQLLDAEAPAWQIGWVNFGIFICAEMCAVVLAQSFGAGLLRERFEANDGELTPWLAVIAVLLIQIPMLVVFYFARIFLQEPSPQKLNSSDFSLAAALRYTAPLFLRFLPVIWIVTFLWTQVLNALKAIHLIDAIEPQALITLFQAGGDPIAIALLILFAVALAPIVEELIFRGCIYRFLKSKMTLIAAQGASAAIFASIHGNLLSFVPLVLVGVLLARIYEKSGCILVSICFHAFFNGFSLLMLFIMSQSNAIPQ